jgi:alkylation response protein AidB-like acyl-CoA dehydrogenase
MDFELTEQQKILKDNLRAFMKREIVPIADTYEQRHIPLTREEAIELMKKLAPLGYVGGMLPTELGGASLDYVTHAVLVEVTCPQQRYHCLLSGTD